jgi:ech hydrogenase subunit D
VIERQTIEEIPVAVLLERVQAMQTGGWRLVQICCTRLVADQEVSYSFDREGTFATLRVRLPIREAELPSISSFYGSAFLYENEMHDLFGLTVKGMTVDYRGQFYATRVPAPYVTKEPGDGD